MKYKNVSIILLIVIFVCNNVYSENEDKTSKTRKEIINLLSLVIDLQNNLQLYKSMVVNEQTNDYSDKLLGNIEKVNESIEKIKGNLIELSVGNIEEMDNSGINLIKIADYIKNMNNVLINEIESLRDKQQN
jgi:predicted transcriptional regulator with HTH domain